MTKLNREEVSALLHHLGHDILPGTWSSMVSRHQAPQPDQRIVRTPLWEETTVREWAAARPGQGARTDRHQTVITDDHRAHCACGKSSPDYEGRYDLTPEVLVRIAEEWATCHGKPLLQMWPHTIYVIGPHEETVGVLRRTVHGPYEAAKVMARDEKRAAATYWGPGVRVDAGKRVGDVTYSTGADYRVTSETGEHLGWVETR